MIVTHTTTTSKPLKKRMLLEQDENSNEVTGSVFHFEQDSFIDEKTDSKTKISDSHFTVSGGNVDQLSQTTTSSISDQSMNPYSGKYNAQQQQQPQSLPSNENLTSDRIRNPTTNQSMVLHSMNSHDSFRNIYPIVPNGNFYDNSIPPYPGTTSGSIMLEGPIKDNSKEFTIMSYNILAQGYMSESRYPYVNKNYYSWKYREKRLRIILDYHDADIICLQEVEPYVFEGLMKKLNETYDGKYAKKGTGKKDGVATFVKRKTFKITGQTFINRLSSHPEVALLLHLRTNDKRDVVVANTHLMGHPDGSMIRANQVKRIVEEIWKKTANAPPSLPCFICGSFNDVPNSYSYELLSKGYTGENLSIPFKFTSVSASMNNQESPFTFWTDKIKKPMDYIWLRNGSSLECVLFKKCWEEVFGPIPAKNHPSNHVPIVSTFKF